MLRGLTTISYFADDLDAAKAWYTELLGIEPYFEVPGRLRRVPGRRLPARARDRQGQLGARTT